MSVEIKHDIIINFHVYNTQIVNKHQIILTQKIVITLIVLENEITKLIYITKKLDHRNNHYKQYIN